MWQFMPAIPNKAEMEDRQINERFTMTLTNIYNLVIDI